MKQATFLAPGSLDRMLRAAEEAHERMDFQACIEILQKASQLAPANTGILLQLGRVHGLRYDYAAAEGFFDQALRLASRKTEMLTAIGERCLEFRSPDLADRFLHRALEQPDSTPQVCVMLAQLYKRLRRLPEAAQLVERTLAANPSHLEGSLVRAQLERQAGRQESAEEILRSFLAGPHPITGVLVQAWYELAAVLDRQGKYHEAMKACLHAKALQGPRAETMPNGQKKLHDSFKVMEAKMSAGMLQRWVENGPALSPSRPMALLGGYARSGTTLLEQVLDGHSGVVSAEETTTFFTDAFPHLKRNAPPEVDTLAILETAGNPVLQQSRRDYFRAIELCIGTPIGSRLLLDKNPMYTCAIPAYIRIFPETRYLIALRDPRDVVLSRFMQFLRMTPGTVMLRTLQGTAEDYASLMSLWRKLAPMMPAPYLEVRYEDVVADLESVARKTLDFLGLPWQDRVLAFDEHARKKVVLSPTYADVTQPIYKRAQGRWRNYQKYLEPILPILEPFIKAFGYE